MFSIHTFESGPFATNVYLLVDEATSQAALVDPSIGTGPVLQEIERLGADLIYIINTHAHVDHAANNAYFKSNSTAALLAHPDDLPLLKEMPESGLMFHIVASPSPMPDRLLADGEEIVVGEGRLRVIHTPGHTPGGICLYAEADGFVLAGDTLFAGSIGRTDFPGGSFPQIIESIQTRLFALPDDTVVYPGHGPATRIGDEKRTNPFAGLGQ